VPLLIEGMKNENAGMFLQQTYADSLIMLGREEGLEFYRSTLARGDGDGTFASPIGMLAGPAEIDFLHRLALKVKSPDYLADVVRRIGFAGAFSSVPFLTDF